MPDKPAIVTLIQLVHAAQSTGQLGLGEIEADGDNDIEADLLGLILALGLTDGLRLGDKLGLRLADNDALIDGLILSDIDALGEGEIEAEGLPAADAVTSR